MAILTIFSLVCLFKGNVRISCHPVDPFNKNTHAEGSPTPEWEQIGWSDRWIDGIANRVVGGDGGGGGMLSQASALLWIGIVSSIIIYHVRHNLYNLLRQQNYRITLIYAENGFSGALTVELGKWK